MKIIIGSDHAGFEYKEDLKRFFVEKNIDFIDCGCKSPDSVDYPDYAHDVSINVLEEKDSFGVLICGSASSDVFLFQQIAALIPLCLFAAIATPFALPQRRKHHMYTREVYFKKRTKRYLRSFH